MELHPFEPYVYSYKEKDYFLIQLKSKHHTFKIGDVFYEPSKKRYYIFTPIRRSKISYSVDDFGLVLLQTKKRKDGDYDFIYSHRKICPIHEVLSGLWLIEKTLVYVCNAIMDRFKFYKLINQNEDRYHKYKMKHLPKINTDSFLACLWDKNTLLNRTFTFAMDFQIKDRIKVVYFNPKSNSIQYLFQEAAKDVIENKELLNTMNLIIKEIKLGNVYIRPYLDKFCITSKYDKDKFEYGIFFYSINSGLCVLQSKNPGKFIKISDRDINNVKVVYKNYHPLLDQEEYNKFLLKLI